MSSISCFRGRGAAALIIAGIAAGPVSADPAAPLSIREAERLSLETDALAQGYEAGARGLTHEATADRQLPDPQLKLATANVPVKSPGFRGEDMTMLEVGVRQMFPRGRTLEHAGNRTSALAEAERLRAGDRRRAVLREVRGSFLELYLYRQSARILDQSRHLFEEMLTIAERQYAAGRDNQHDLLRAQLELTLLDDRLAEIRGEQDAAAADLARWVSDDHAARAPDDSFPALPPLPDLAAIRAALETHPAIRLADAGIDVGRHEVELAREQYKPGWMLDVGYGQRSGGRDDLFSAMLLVDIPLFTGKRQDQRLAAAQQQQLAARFARADRLRELLREAEREHALWRQFERRIELYEKRAAVDAGQNAEAALVAYRNYAADFTTLVRARLTEVDTRLETLRLKVARARVHANLLYYSGEES
jgi:outer membrane protein TolC